MPHRLKSPLLVASTDPVVARAAARLEKQVHKLWLLGRNIILGWHRAGTQLQLAYARNAELSRIAAEGRSLLFSRVRRLDAAAFAALVQRFALETAAIDLHQALAVDAQADAIERIVALHSVAHEAARPVALVDIVGFSLLDPVDQLVQLNSLAYSLTMAERRCKQLGLDIDIGQSTTGDGFYLWNRSAAADADAQLFVALLMALSDNVISARREHRGATPQLRSAFAVGGYFRFLQAEAGGLTSREYIVGESTVALARLIAGAAPGQILLRAPADDAPDAAVTAERLVGRIRATMDGLDAVPLNGVRLRGCAIYPTGRADGRGGFAIDRYQMRDKHGLVHHAYNIKANLYPEDGEPLFLGIMHREIEAIARPRDVAAAS